MNGFSTISNPKNHVFSRISWGILLLLGVTFTVKNIADCFSKYLSYPTITKTSEIPVNASVEAFPKLTICLNSQQSIWKIQKYYPDTYEEILAGLPFLYGSYGDNHGEKFRDFRYKDRSVLDSLDLEKFMNSTSGEMEIIACKFLNRDCRDSWDKILTIYGTCLVFTPSSDRWKMKKQKSLFGRQSSISISVKYNITDWTAGWTHYIEGCTIFVSPTFEETLDPDDSIILTPGGLPILSVRQKKVKLLGNPFKDCRERDAAKIHPNPLMYFEKYTMKHCQMECLIKEIKKKCHCNAPFFPYLAKIDDLGFCNFTQHSFCVSNQIVAHDNLECQGCELECDSENFVHGNLQYAELDLKSPDHRRQKVFNSSQTGISSMLLYQADTILTETESPEYTRFEFMSDIGGTAGLILGVSLASMISTVERLVRKMFRKLIRLTETKKVKRNPNHLSAL